MSAPKLASPSSEPGDFFSGDLTIVPYLNEKGEVAAFRVRADDPDFIAWQRAQPGSTIVEVDGVDASTLNWRAAILASAAPNHPIVAHALDVVRRSEERRAPTGHVVGVYEVDGVTVARWGGAFDGSSLTSENIRDAMEILDAAGPPTRVFGDDDFEARWRALAESYFARERAKAIVSTPEESLAIEVRALAPKNRHERRAAAARGRRR